MNGRRTLLKSATLVTMDGRLGVLERADLLVHGERIAAIAPRIEEADAQVVDCAGRIVIPGLVNAHLHTWQTGLRGAAADWTLPEYFRNMHAGLATFFTPEDVNVATLAGALNQLNAGTTTLVDWCHNNPTPEHTDAAIEGLRWCYRIVRADGVEHDAEVALLERAGARFFGGDAGARTVEFLRQDHRTILLREALEESAFAAGVRVSNGGEA